MARRARRDRLDTPVRIRIWLAAVLLLGGGCSPSLDQLSFDHSVCVSFDLSAADCERIVREAARRAPAVDDVSAVGLWPEKQGYSGQVETDSTRFRANVVFAYRGNSHAPVVVQVRQGADDTLVATLMPADYAVFLGVPPPAQP